MYTRTGTKLCPSLVMGGGDYRCVYVSSIYAVCAKISNVLVGHLLYSQTPPVENGPFPLDFFSTGFLWSLF